MEKVKYRCRTVHPLTCNAMVFTGLIVDAHLDEIVLRQTAAQLVKAWPALGGQLYRSGRPYAHSTGSTVDFASRTLPKGAASWKHGVLQSTECSQPTVIDALDPEELDAAFIFNVPARPANTFLIRVTLLQDANLLCFGISHHLADGTAAYDVIRAYCDLLAGRPITSPLLPPDACGHRMSDRVIPNDPQEKLVRSITYAEHLSNFTTGFWPILLLIARVVWCLLLRKLCLQETLQERYIYLPDDWVGAMHKRPLAAFAPTTVGAQPTRNNVINACYRRVVEPPQPGTYWIHNSIGLLRHKLSVSQIQNESVAKLAGGLRLVSLRYTSPASIKAFLRMCEDHSSQRMLPKIPAKGRVPMVMVTTWTGFDFARLDFSGAACDENKPVRVLFVHPLVRSLPQGVRPSAHTLKGVREGGYWLRAWNTPSGWKRFSQMVIADTLMF
ncbi:hypothetical protein BO83DRAFT_398940 [Aspergillus eucalypticola CBS 122712]|uniref:Transferase family protein n=1 Tax=Aspergillus eucalypticola (strain CBS 122712 / IBT 29274) TaxID=1448314 RepID=A0A317VNL9_ASPEC|nr:uncharacterized protein BO83DRAFT_398940 [Aspergillus eucalypticola CBS 122712]PWY73530.1 hypothetical protein BO83DRAFT_398940 [Aspergillus eucalypticola CBS 122712]